ncbi:uncharacterized protein LOC143371723 [Andrena cerasifolii]|uniref:uncharacterized protein LOC143371723 n=1 Tax=Andrena cerasifolii TaxID=2819439 RepID=UPI0040383140
MGVRQSRRSVDITTTPKKEGAPAEGGVGDAAAPGDGKLERIEETDTKPTTNGIAPHTDVTEDKDDATEKEKEKEKDKKKEKEKPDEVKAEETKQESTGESPAETVEATTPTEATPASPNTATSPDSKETKKKDKMKKKWSFRSISFSKKDKSKPAREEAPKNGDVTKEEPLAEGGEEAENGSATAGSPVEDKSAVSSLSEEKEAAPVSAAEAAAAVSAAAATTETKEDAPAASVTSSPADEQQEEPTPSAPTPVPVEEKKEEVEKVEAEKKVVEVSRAGDQSVPDPVEVQTVATPSIIERKTSEDIPSLPPSSPPPTPIDPSPLQQAQQAQQAAATATALAEALKLPAEAAGKDIIAPAPSSLPSSSPERNGPSTPPAESLDVYPQRSTSSSTDEPPTESTPAPPKPEALPVVDTDASNPEVAVETSSEPVTGHDSQIPALQAPPVSSQSDAKSLDDAPAAQQQDSPLSASNEEELVTEAPAEAVDSEKACEIKAVEKSEPLVVVGTLEKPVAVEEPVQTDLVCDVASAPFAGDQEPEMAAESVATEEPVVCEGEKRPEIVNLAEHVEELAEELVEADMVVQEGTAAVEQVVIDPPVLVSDSFLESEEGLVPISEEILVEAKPAVVIPEDEETVEQVVDTDADAEVSKVETESVEVVPDVEDKLEMETESDIAAPSAESLVFEELEDTFPLNEEDVDSVQPVVEANTIIEESDEKRKDVRAIVEAEEAMPSPAESPVPSPHEHHDSENAVVEDDPTTVPSLVDIEPHIVEVEKTTEVEDSPSQNEDIQMVTECSLLDCPVPPTEASSPQPLGSPMRPVVEKDANLANESEPMCPRLERVPTPAGDLPAAVQDTTSQHVDSMEYPLPPEELSCPLIASSNAPEMKSELPVPDQSASASSLRNPTETLLTPPRSPSPQSNVSITSGQTTSTKDSSQTQFYDDQSNREFKMESVSISLNSYNESEIELKERLAESLAKTVNQEESSVSCQLSNKATSSTTVQETHQSTPEPEAPVENNVAHDSTTESSDDTKKVTPPAVPTEVPASPPSAPVITEDVASVAKAIEEIDISDKAVAAATIECNTNEIIADAHYQNNINE